MSVQTLTVKLQADNPVVLSFNAYNARTFDIVCVGDMSAADNLRAEIHTSRKIGATPVAMSEDDEPGASTTTLRFEAPEMNLLPGTDSVCERTFWLVVYSRIGSGDSAERTTLYMGKMKLLANPGSDIAPPDAMVLPYLTEQEAMDLFSGLSSRYVRATLAEASDQIIITGLTTGEDIVGAVVRSLTSGIFLLGATVSSGTATLQFSNYGPVGGLSVNVAIGIP